VNIVKHPDARLVFMETISHNEIKEKLTLHHNPDEMPENRALMVVRIDITAGGGDVVFFVLPGSPPDGYGIFIPGYRLLTLYTTHGRPFEEITVKEVVSSCE